MRKWLIAVVCLLMVPWVGTVLWVWGGENVEKIAGERKDAACRESGEGEMSGDAEGDAEENTEENSEGNVEVAEMSGDDQGAVASGKMQRWVILDDPSTGGYRRLEDYLPGVVACQMPDQIDGGPYDPEVWKCQAVIARTYICHVMADRETIHEEELDLDYPGEKQDLLAAGNEQAVRKLELAEEAVAATSGVVMKYEERCILPMFHEISAGQTRTGGKDFPYLQSVNSNQDTKRDEYLTMVTFPDGEFVSRITRITDASRVSLADLPKAIQTIRRDAAGYMEEIQIGASTYTGDEIRYSLGLPSAHFTLEPADEGILVTVQGRGHGYGLSQAGADSLAREDWTYEEILQYYYKNIVLVCE